MRRVLRGGGYRFFYSRKKGLLKKDDLKKRRKFAGKFIKMLTDKFWEEGISFYIDAAGFQHKYNPHGKARSIQTMAWQLKDEGLHPHYTGKRFHVGSAGRVAHFIVAIAYQKGVLLYEQYESKTNGDMFLESKKARPALDTTGAIKFSIPPRSPDFNPIENFLILSKVNYVLKLSKKYKL